MTRREVDRIVQRLGLSTWVVEAVAVGETSRTVTLRCVGFSSLDLPLGEAETWDEALEQALRIVFAA